MSTQAQPSAAVSAHTPGDWYFYETHYSGFRIAVKYGNSSPIQIATVHTSDEHGRLSGDRIFANARLIAAAPTLLEACRMVMACDNGRADLSATLEAVRAAIAAAEVRA